jgi:hypothetical protein
MSVIQQAIESLEQAAAGLEQRRAAVLDVIGRLRDLESAPAMSIVHIEPIILSPPTPRPDKPKPAAAVAPVAPRLQRAVDKLAAPSSLRIKHSVDIQQRILAHLKTVGGPIRPGELAHALQADAVTIRHAVTILESQGKVTASGVTNQRRIRLAGGATKKAPPAPVDAQAASDAKDDEILQRIRASGRVGRSVTELVILLPDETGVSVTSALRRLKWKNLVDVDAAGKWTAIETKA